MNIVTQAKPSTNGHTTRPTHRKTGRELCQEAIRLRVYLGQELRKQCEAAGLDAEHYGSSAVTALCIGLERRGVAGIPEDCDVVQ